jgi:hypothetical protein
LGIGGGFLLAILLPLARTLDWDWGATQRWAVYAQVHGQLQLVGFGGLFVMGMSFRIMPRVSGRWMPMPRLIPLLLPAFAASLIVRSAAQPLSDGFLRDAGLVVSAGLMAGAAVGFAGIAWATLLHRESRAGATGYFFVMGAAGLVAGSVINAVQTSDMVRDSLAVAPSGRQTVLVFTQQFGFLMMFVMGVGSRAIPGLTGRPLRAIASRLVALVYGAGVAGAVVGLLLAVERRPSELIVRLADLSMLVVAAGFVALAWISGALVPGSNVARASRVQFLFVRCAMAWLVVAAALIALYAGRALIDGRALDQFEFDAIRHTITVGVLTTLIIGMAMLIVPEFAGRRLQHPNEAWLHIAMLVALTVAAALRIWPAIEGVDWLEDTRFWPMAWSGLLATSAVGAFGAAFAQSWWEQRSPDWAARASGVDVPVNRSP